ncbi:MAG TPA: SurA N-terminal domain-containing protein [Kiritimatiellia bacterium]|nr:SurA N-terminal domain-containing protein [Kiritimatiellia bacterium]
MMISKFHKLIQSKLLWITFLVIVIFSFVVWGTAVPDSKDRRDAASPGSLEGKPIDPSEFRQAYFSTYLTVVMAIGQAINITPAIDEQLNQAAWQRIAALRAAKRMGITSSDDEVAGAIQQHEGFNHQGQFNVMAYKAFVQNFLARYGFSERQFEEHVREEITLQKTRSVLDRTTLITPLELQRAFRTVTDRFEAEYVLLPGSSVESDVNIGEAEALAFYEKDPARFTLPAQVRVDYIRVAAAPFIPRTRVTEEEIQAYYDENLRQFIDESAQDESAAETNFFGALTRYRPLEDMRQDISNRLLEEKAMEEAFEAAMNAVVALTPDREGNARTFAEIAEQLKLPVQSAEPFALQDEIPGIEVGPEFNRAAFELLEGPESYFSNPVRGSNAVYVIALRERIQPRVPAFEEVKARVLEIARGAAMADALKQKAETLRTEMEKALEEKITFADALAFHGLKPSTTGVFSASTGIDGEDEDRNRLILASVLSLNRGEISEPIPTPEGYLLIHVADRRPGEAMSLEAIRPQLVDSIRRQSGRLVFDSWQNHLLKKGGFEPRQKPVREADEDDEDFEDEEAG